MLLLMLVFTGLGVWQVQRLFWKLDLIDRVEARIHAAPVPPPAPAQWHDVSTERDEYRHVLTSGRFDHSREVLVQAVTERGPGFWVLTPLMLDDGTTILINRGFVPPDRRDPATRPQGQVSGVAEIKGLLRMSEEGGGFLRSNSPQEDRWYSRDVSAIASAKTLSRVAPFFIDADASSNPGGFPIGGLTVVQFRNTHLVYALTWFTLAVMSGGITYVLWRRRLI
jgi:surfeit locus 1 family protein